MKKMKNTAKPRRQSSHISKNSLPLSKDKLVRHQLIMQIMTAYKSLLMHVLCSTVTQWEVS